MISDGSIALMTSAHVAGFNMALCARLKYLTGRRVILYVQGDESVKKHQQFIRDGVIDEVVNCGLFHDYCLKLPVPDDVVDQASSVESWIGATYNSVFMSKRDAGRGFALGGLYHPRSPFSDCVTYSQLLNGQTKMFQFWRSEIERKQIALFLNGTLEVDLVCRALNVPFRTMYAARYKNRFFWAQDVLVAPPRLEQAFRSASDAECAPVRLDVPYTHEVETRKLFVGNNGIARFFKFAGAVTLRYMYLTLKGYRSSATYYLQDQIRYHWNYYKSGELLVPPLTTPVTAIADRPFVFFPLQTEPEFSLQVMSQECFSQLAVIASLARDLPAGAILAVKETIWGMGRRPADFYRQILEFKNVVLLDVRESGLSVIKHATAVATISGSAGIEAAMMGRPVILFGRHNGYGFLPHVIEVAREEDLRPAVSRIFSGEIDAAESVRAGARFANALEAVSFDLGTFAAFQSRTWKSEHAQVAAENLLASVASNA